MPCKQNEGRKREPPQKILIAHILKDVNGDFLLWHLTFLTQMFKKYSEESLPPLIFHSLWSINGAPVSLQWGKYAGFRGDSVRALPWPLQVVKWARAGLGTRAFGGRAASLCSKDTPSPVFAQCWQSRESRPHCLPERWARVGGWVRAASDELTSQIRISLSPPITLISLWAGLCLCSPLPSQAREGSDSFCCAAPGHARCCWGWWLVRLYGGRQTLYE